LARGGVYRRLSEAQFGSARVGGAVA